MQFNKKVKVGVVFICLLLLFTTGISLIDIGKQNKIVDKNSLSLSPAEDPYEMRDGYINNDEPANATDITDKKGNWLSYLDVNGTQSNDDYFKVFIPYGKVHLLVNLTFSNSSGNIDLAVYNSVPTKVNESITTTDNEAIDYNITTTTGGIFYFKVFGENKSNTYDLWWSLEDNYEENDDFWSAKSIFPNYYSNLQIVDGDNDWFKLENITYGDFLNITIYFNNSEGDLQLELYDQYNTYQIGNYSNSDDEIILFDATLSGNWSIRVYHQYGNSSVKYDLDIWVNAGMFGGGSYEPNENFTDAWGIGPGYYSNLEIVGDDEDWFQLDLNIGDVIYVDIYFNHSEGDLDLFLYDPLGNYQTSNSSITDNEAIWYNITNSGNWRIRVYHYYKNSTVKYDLNIYVNAVDDLYDNGIGNDYKWDASYISPAVKIDDLIQKDDDWYEIYIALGKELIYVELTSSLGNIQMQLYNNFSSYPTDWSFYKDSKQIIDTYAPSGTYFIKVYGNNASNSYDLLWEDLSTRYPEEYFEPNNNYLTAFDISGPDNETMAHRGIQWNEDWFRIYAEEWIHADINYDFMTGQDIKFEIYYYNSTYNGIEIIAWILGNETFIDIPIPWNGTYYIRVFGNNSGGRYELSWQSTTFSSSYGDDAYEPNNFKGQAYYLSPFAASWLPDGLGIQFDDDWYEVFLDPGEERIYIELTFSHALGNIDIEVYNDSSPDPIAGSYSLDDNEYIDVNVTMFGKYFIRVFGDNASNPYDLWWEDLSPTEMDDYYEENDFWDQAYDLSGWENDWLSSLYSGEGIQLDDDWYMVDVKSEIGHLIVEINFDHFEGNISLELYDDSHSLLESSDSSDNYAFVDFELQKSGTYYIHVFGENKGNWYDLKWRTQDEAKDFYDDSYEDNNEFYKAYSLWDDERTWLRNIADLAVQGDDDWYLIDVSAGFLHLKVDVIFNHSAGDIDIEIYEVVNFDEVNPVIENNSRTDNEYINYTLSHPGPYFIQIHGENAGNEYDLWWDDLRTLFDEDIYEPNDGYENATDITANDNFENNFAPGEHGGPKISADGPENDILSLRTTDGLGLQYDEDWYEIYVPEDRLSLIILLEYDYAEGVMGLIVYDSDHREIAENFTKHDGEFIIINLQSNGTYYIRVFGDNTGNVYDLMWATSEFLIDEIPGYDILILLGSLFGIVSIIAIKWKRSKLKQK